VLVIVQQILMEKKCTCSKSCKITPPPNNPPPQNKETCNCNCQNGQCKCDKDTLSNGQQCSCSQSCTPPPNTPPPSNICNVRDYPNFEQCDSRWGNDFYSKKYTFCQVGCLVVAVANYMNARGIQINGETADPKNLNNYIQQTGGYIQDYTFPFTRINKLGLKYKGLQHDFSKIKTYICAGNAVILLMKKKFKHK